ncbi:MAG TPA: DUF4019 domain-containing protein [Salinibacter sp.]|nr:DUF4019 domain-containing protein [Salinibacter sp.]
MHRVGCIAGSVLCSLLLLTGVVRAQPSDRVRAEAKQNARAAATAWLARVDDGDFEESWETAAVLLQERVPREQWEDEGRELRDSLRALSGRTRTMVQYRDTLRRAPSGPFVILMYRSSFDGGRVEELLLTVREEGTWKVAGYQVTPLRHDRARPSSLFESSGSS